MPLLSELQRRDVFQVSIAYLVVAWVLVRIANLVPGDVSAPDWTLPVLLAAITAGFPVAVAVAWLYEITPHGIRRQDHPGAAWETGGRRVVACRYLSCCWRRCFWPQASSLFAR